MTDGLSKFAGIISACLIAAGLVLAILGFDSDRQYRMQQFTVEYARNYYSAYLQVMRSRLRSHLFLIESVDKRVPNETLAVLLADAVKKSENNLLADAAIAVADYFNGAKGCVEAGLCDRDLMRKLNANEATSLICLLIPSLDVLSFSGGNSSLKSGLQFFAADDQKCSD